MEKEMEDLENELGTTERRISQFITFIISFNLRFLIQIGIPLKETFLLVFVWQFFPILPMNNATS